MTNYKKLTLRLKLFNRQVPFKIPITFLRRRQPSPDTEIRRFLGNGFWFHQPFQDPAVIVIKGES